MSYNIMEKDSKTTVAVERTTFTKLDRLAKANNVSKMEFLTHAINYFEKYGINPVEHESPAQEMQKLIKRMDQVFAFLKKQETDLVRPACEALAGASTQITISLSSLLSEEKFRRFLKENSELFIEVMNQSSEKGKAIDRAERAVRDSDATIRKNQQAIFKRIEANETAQLKAMQHIVSFLDAKGKTGLLDDINKVYEREKERRGL
ncbi:clindamycin resistance transfer factor btgA (plasmid) [Bacteroides thetaiotaomicron]|jgi:spore germination protein YaaH|nr:clindamycin resistance transfer factor btgA [Bacteroides thetaiotaomicron]